MAEISDNDHDGRPSAAPQLPPNRLIAAEAIRSALGREPVSITRFPLARTHFVYDVVLTDGARCVLRMSVPAKRYLLQGAVYWSGKLRPLGVPLPAIMGQQLDESAPFPYLIIERLAGTDLSMVYDQLTQKQKRGIVDGLVDIQSRIATLPKGGGYGGTTHYGRWPCSTFSELKEAILERYRKGIGAKGLFDLAYVEEVQEKSIIFQPYFATIESTPFFPDMTTKNVIIHEGRLTGIVDVDQLGFGDPLHPVALTKTILLRKGSDLSYVRYWCKRLQLRPVQLRALDFYAAMSCLGLMSDLSKTLKPGRPMPVREAYVAEVKKAMATLLHRLRRISAKDIQ